MRHLFTYVVDAIRRPRDELSKRQNQLRFGWELIVHCFRQLIRHRAEGMAAELTYRTIFALIPVLVLGLVMFRIVGGLEDVQQRVEYSLYSFFGVPEIPEEYILEAIEDQTPVDREQVEPSLVDEAADESSVASVPNSEAKTENEEPTATAATTETMAAENDDVAEEMDQLVSEVETERRARASIRAVLHEATTKIAALDFASIGVIGLLLFIYAAIALADSTESIFNMIYEAPTHRPIHIRVAIHWSIITLGSGLLATSLYLSSQAVDWVGQIGAGATILGALNHVLSVMASFVLLFLLYALMPNTYVSLRAATAGAFVAAALWEAAKFGFQFYVITALPYSALYGSLGLIPLFLFWMYVTWWIFLFGLILTHTLQMLRGRRPRRINSGDASLLHGDPDWMLPIMKEVSIAFDEGKSIDLQQLADRLGLGSGIVGEMVNRLVQGNLLCRVSRGAGSEESLCLARPAEKIELSEILKLAHASRPKIDHPGWDALEEIKQSECAFAADKTLASI